MTGKTSFMKKILILGAVLSLLFLSACGSSDGISGGNNGIGGSWCPSITKEKKNEYMKKAAEVMMAEYGVEVSSEGAKSPVHFVMRKGALPSNKKDAMERMDDWQYSVYVRTNDGVRYSVELAYESMELRLIYEETFNSNSSVGSYVELRNGEYGGLTSEFEEKAKNRADDFQKLLIAHDKELLQSAMKKETRDNVTDEDFEALFDVIADGEIVKGTCMPQVKVDFDDNRMDYLMYRYYFDKNSGETYILHITEADGEIVYIGVRNGSHTGPGNTENKISVNVE